jgi:hypothetical protein
MNNDNNIRAKFALFGEIFGVSEDEQQFCVSRKN